MLTWLLRLLGFRRDHPPEGLDVGADATALDQGAVAQEAADAAPQPMIVVDAVVQIEEPPWTRRVSVQAMEPSIVRRHALRQLAELDTEASGVGDRAYFDRLRRLLEADQLDLPPFPDVARELDGLLKETTTDILQIARVVERDPGLVRRVWTQARSALYASPPRSLHHAVARVGLDALWRIGMSVCLNDTVLRVEGFEQQAAQLRMLGIVTAEVAAHLGGEKRGNLYMAGLLHDVGPLLALRAAGDGRASERPDAPLVVQAQDQVGAALSVLVAESWGLDEAVAVGVGFSADVDRAPNRHARVAKVVRAASIAAHAACLQRAGVDFGPIDPAKEIQRLGFEPRGALERADELFRMLESDGQPEIASA